MFKDSEIAAFKSLFTEAILSLTSVHETFFNVIVKIFVPTTVGAPVGAPTGDPVRAYCFYVHIAFVTSCMSSLYYPFSQAPELSQISAFISAIVSRFVCYTKGKVPFTKV